jgi:hypothetical protein
MGPLPVSLRITQHNPDLHLGRDSAGEQPTATCDPRIPDGQVKVLLDGGASPRYVDLPNKRADQPLTCANVPARLPRSRPSGRENDLVPAVSRGNGAGMLRTRALEMSLAGGDPARRGAPVARGAGAGRRAARRSGVCRARRGGDADAAGVNAHRALRRARRSAAERKAAGPSDPAAARNRGRLCRAVNDLTELPAATRRIAESGEPVGSTSAPCRTGSAPDPPAPATSPSNSPPPAWCSTCSPSTAPTCETEQADGYRYTGFATDSPRRPASVPRRPRPRPRPRRGPRRRGPSLSRRGRIRAAVSGRRGQSAVSSGSQPFSRRRRLPGLLRQTDRSNRAAPTGGSVVIEITPSCCRRPGASVRQMH